MTDLEEAADISRDGAGSMRGIDPIHFPERVGEFDHPRIVAAVREILIGIGEDPDRGAARNPERVARAYAEMFGGLRQDPEKVLATVFDLGHDELVLVKDIEVGAAANTTWCHSPVSPTSATSPTETAGSPASASWLASLTSTPSGPRSRSD